MSSERHESGEGGLTIDRGTYLLLWFCVLSYLDFTTARMIQDKQLVVMQSVILVGIVMLVTMSAKQIDG